MNEHPEQDICGTHLKHEMPFVAGSCSGTLVVAGAGHTLFDDIARLGKIEADWMAINEAGFGLPFKFQHWASMHPQMFQHWALIRGYRIENGTYVPKDKWHCHGNSKWPLVRTVWQFADQMGSSGLYGVRIGLLLGYERIILVGCPYEGHRFFDPPGYEDAVNITTNCGLEPWETLAKICNGRVKSMSGHTRRILGEP